MQSGVATAFCRRTPQVAVADLLPDQFSFALRRRDGAQPALGLRDLLGRLPQVGTVGANLGLRDRIPVGIRGGAMREGIVFDNRCPVSFFVVVRQTNFTDDDSK